MSWVSFDFAIWRVQNQKRGKHTEEDVPVLKKLPFLIAISLLKNTISKLSRQVLLNQRQRIIFPMESFTSSQQTHF